MRIVRLANYVAPNSGGLRTSLRELGAGYLAASHEPVLVIPGERDGDEQTSQGRVITLSGPRLPFTGGYRVLLRQRRVAALLGELRPDTLEVSDRTTLRWTGRWAREHGVGGHDLAREPDRADQAGGTRPGSALAVPVGSRAGPGRRGQPAHRARLRAGDLHDRVGGRRIDRIGAANLVHARSASTWPPSPHPTPVRDAYAAPGETLLVHCGRLSQKKPQRSLNTLATLRAKSVPARLVVAGGGRCAAGGAPRGARGPAGHLRRFPAGPRGPGRTAGQRRRGHRPGPGGTFGLAGLEALACGTPVVVSAESALPEVVGEAGASVAGEDLAAGVMAVLRRPEAARRAAAGPGRAVGWAVAVAGWLAIHEELAASLVGTGPGARARCR